MTFRLHGPNAEFLLGRLVERTEHAAYDSITEQIKLNSILSTGKDASDTAKQDKFLRRAAALEKYDSFSAVIGQSRVSVARSDEGIRDAGRDLPWTRVVDRLDRVQSDSTRRLDTAVYRPSAPRTRRRDKGHCRSTRETPERDRAGGRAVDRGAAA
jgi:hypothetical protein